MILTEIDHVAIAVRDQPGIEAVVLLGAPASGGVALVAAVRKGYATPASELIGPAAKLVGGGGGKAPELAVAGGRNPEAIPDALAAARASAGLPAA